MSQSSVLSCAGALPSRDEAARTSLTCAIFHYKHTGEERFTNTGTNVAVADDTLDLVADARAAEKDEWLVHEHEKRLVESELGDAVFDALVDEAVRDIKHVLDRQWR